MSGKNYYDAPPNFVALFDQKGFRSMSYDTVPESKIVPPVFEQTLWVGSIKQASDIIMKHGLTYANKWERYKERWEEENEYLPPVTFKKNGDLL